MIYVKNKLVGYDLDAAVRDGWALNWRGDFRNTVWNGTHGTAVSEAELAEIRRRAAEGDENCQWGIAESVRRKMCAK